MDQLDEIEAIQAEINRLDDEERKIELELLDVFTDVQTPTTSEDEDEEEEDIHVERDPIIRLFKEAILSASGFPTRMCAYLERYEDPIYRRNAVKKLKCLKKFVKSSNMDEILRNPLYLTTLTRIRETYPDHGGREFLNELIAVFCLYNQ